MSSGLPVNSFSQAREYRNRYLANLALEVQNDMMNLNANQVYKQTGQPSRPPDSRSTTEKLADLEGLKVSLRAGLLGITDGTQASETVDQLTPAEVVFASQQLPAITADLKPRFVRGVPSNALLNYIRALQRKELQTNGVSFTAQESTAQQILNALQAGQNQMGGNAGPIPGGPGNPVNPPPPGPPGGGQPPGGPPAGPMGPSEDELLQQQNMLRREQQTRQQAEEWLARGNVPFTSLARNVQDMINAIRAERGQGGEGGTALLVGRFKQDEQMKQNAQSGLGLDTQEQWNAFPTRGGFGQYPDNDEIAKQYLKWWGQSQTPDIQALFARNWDRKKTSAAMKAALFPGWQMKNAVMGQTPNEADVFQSPGSVVAVPEIATPFSPVEAVRVLTVDDVEVSTRQELKTWWNTTRQYYQNRDPEAYRNIIRIARDYGLITETGVAIPNNKGLQEIQQEIIPVIDYVAGKEGTNVVSAGRGMARRRPGAPASRYPTGREILGYGLSRGVSSEAKRSEFVGMPVAEVSFSPFGKFIIDTNKLASNILDVRTQRGNKMPKYKQHQMSGQLAKTMKRIMGGRMIDEYDFNEMPLEDQSYLWDLARDAKIMDRLQLPTPKRTKSGEEENRFEILKGQIAAGNDSKELVKEFKVMLLKFSNDGRIKKNEAREILLDLTALGY